MFYLAARLIYFFFHAASIPFYPSLLLDLFLTTFFCMCIFSVVRAKQQGRLSYPHSNHVHLKSDHLFTTDRSKAPFREPGNSQLQPLPSLTSILWDQRRARFHRGVGSCSHVKCDDDIPGPPRQCSSIKWGIPDDPIQMTPLMHPLTDMGPDISDLRFLFPLRFPRRSRLDPTSFVKACLMIEPC